MDRHNHCQVACKKFRTPAKGTLTGEAFTSEVAILARLKHVSGFYCAYFFLTVMVSAPD